MDLLFCQRELAAALQVIDVALDDNLVLRYGERLPVLQVVSETGRPDGTEDEFAGPWQAAELGVFLRRIAEAE